MHHFHSVHATDAAVDAAINERRMAHRHRILQRCFVRPAGSSPDTSWKSIAYDISLTGIGVALPYPLAVGTILMVEASGLRSATALQARMVRHKAVSHLWFCGCEFSVPMTSEELRHWLAAKSADLPDGLVV
jgi:hypothetical protein